MNNTYNIVLTVFLGLLVIFMISSCGYKKQEQWRHIEISSLDKSQTITIITEGNNRYIMDGSHETIPEANYLLLDISEVDPIGDGIAVCWNDLGYKWKIDSAYATLIENKLDTINFLYFSPRGKYGEPVSTGYEGNNCGGALIRENILLPKNSIILEYK